MAKKINYVLRYKSGQTTVDGYGTFEDAMKDFKKLKYGNGFANLFSDLKDVIPVDLIK